MIARKQLSHILVYYSVFLPIAQNRSFTELINDFYSLIYGCEISDEEMDVMRTVAREAGVINEAG